MGGLSGVGVAGGLVEGIFPDGRGGMVSGG